MSSSEATSSVISHHRSPRASRGRRCCWCTCTNALEWKALLPPTSPTSRKRTGHPLFPCLRPSAPPGTLSSPAQGVRARRQNIRVDCYTCCPSPTSYTRTGLFTHGIRFEPSSSPPQALSRSQRSPLALLALTTCPRPPPRPYHLGLPPQRDSVPRPRCETIPRRRVPGRARCRQRGGLDAALYGRGG